MIQDNVLKSRCVKSCSSSKVVVAPSRMKPHRGFGQKSPCSRSHMYEQLGKLKVMGVKFSPMASSVESEVLLHGDLTSCKLIHLTEGVNANKLMIFLPGTDGTGQSILSQLETLEHDGWDVWSLFLPIKERSGWSELTARTAELIRILQQQWSPHASVSSKQSEHHDSSHEIEMRSSGSTITLVGESFGGCLAIRVALWEPNLIDRLVVINPATCFNESLNGLSALISGTNFLGLFPEQWYTVAQATLLPLLVDMSRVNEKGQEQLKNMVSMEPADPLLLRPGSITVPPRSNNSQSSSWLPQLPLALLGYGPAAAANFRVGLLRDSDLPDVQLRRLSVPTLIISSAKDRMLPSIEEGARLLRLIPQSTRIILPDSGHAALLEDTIDLAALITRGKIQESLSQKLHVVPRGTREEVNSKSRRLPHGTGVDEETGSRHQNAGGLGRQRLVADTLANSNWAVWAQRLAPMRELISPVVLGGENLPLEGSMDWSRPMLFVGNHGKMGFYDTPFLMYELYLRGYHVRGLAHLGHWKGPFGSFMESFGAVRASPMAAFRLLRSNEKVLLFPGGAREVVKKRSEEYQLLWKDTPDFVRLAAKCKAIIVPFASVGADDAYDVIMETEEQLRHPVLGPLFRGVLQGVSKELDPEESVFPLTRMPGLGLPTPIPVPNLNRLYFKFGTPVDTAQVKLDLDNDQECQELYDHIKNSVNQDLAELIALRQNDSDRDVAVRLRRSVSSLVNAVSNATGSDPTE
ncbi:hypothetical protein CEUSTIGMA_g1731.t1 [Chlamydomonas eustigma]|uniref:Phospholipid/glycerol acyltransferase domain-containing protein n=1 Tax=Chlamydomonas eustigma TaxID=1157962 RepID=A0A250WUH1_9CHLO|nr:hypothetical protein CEUSTIGMA_g1731.t1 [Chlamydomonas eustigma]|eukprot:GAX74282.1 hypothetical protein CEUSTIGMA_g1731.t1 [Chlamydomonas eustigma]